MITIKRTNSANKDFRKLVGYLDDYLAKANRTPHSICKSCNKIDTIKHCIIIYSANEAVGCGAIREYSPDTMEIKRMFVVESERRRGIASIILNELEQWAKELNFGRCILETSNKLPQAIALYRMKGYSQIPNYGQYECLDSSICFSKDI
ncbi:MAG: GNAT family N-acetyltransferase [Tannerellaceae bacterium]|jgi:GNAT superfamily N-acetyltransferase|nr:GNAT family N-acetyltransferase [Tannerellaceae bacterium]